jgi:hypothetical protein
MTDNVGATNKSVARRLRCHIQAAPSLWDVADTIQFAARAKLARLHWENSARFVCVIANLNERARTSAEGRCLLPATRWVQGSVQGDVWQR